MFRMTRKFYFRLFLFFFYSLVGDIDHPPHTLQANNSKFAFVNSMHVTAAAAGRPIHFRFSCILFPTFVFRSRIGFGQYRQ